MPNEPIRVVFDTVVFVRGLINPRGRWGVLLFDRAPSYRLVVSPHTVAEALEVLRRPAVVRLFRPVADRNPAAVEALLVGAETVDIDVATMPRVSRDAKDDKFLATAVAGSAEYIVSEDDDLLVLREHNGIAIVDAVTFLRILDEHAVARPTNGTG